MNFIKKMKNSEGFTLMELLLVIIIIGIMAGIGGGYYLTSLKRGNDGKRAGDLNNLRNALEMYFTDNGEYPGTGSLSTYESINTALSGLTSGTDRYLNVLPEDPKDDREYLFSSNGSCYCLSAQMEVDSNYRTSIGDCSCPDDHEDDGTDACYLVTCP